MTKKMLTREEFEDERTRCAEAMAADTELLDDARNVLVRADRHSWIHQTTWFGEPVLNLTQDLFALQEIIFRTRPRFIVEVGVAWGGSLLFYSTLMEVLGGDGHIIAVDVYIPDDLRKRIGQHGRLAERIKWLNGESTDPVIVDAIREIIGDIREVLVILDSHHTHDHVLSELRLYSPFVGKGQYLVCCDTIIEDIPKQEHRGRPWGPANNPKTALDVFHRENSRFAVDPAIENKLLMSCNSGGYLLAVGD